MSNDMKRWHRAVVRNIASTFGLSEDLSHHHRAKAPHRHRNKPFHHRNHAFHHRHNERVANWHAQHAADVMTGTGWLSRWERLVYGIVRNVIKVAK